MYVTFYIVPCKVILLRVGDTEVEDYDPFHRISFGRDGLRMITRLKYTFSDFKCNPVSRCGIYLHRT